MKNTMINLSGILACLTLLAPLAAPHDPAKSP
jgi:hypothetical protein